MSPNLPGERCVLRAQWVRISWELNKTSDRLLVTMGQSFEPWKRPACRPGFPLSEWRVEPVQNTTRLRIMTQEPLRLLETQQFFRRDLRVLPGALLRTSHCDQWSRDVRGSWVLSLACCVAVFSIPSARLSCGGKETILHAAPVPAIVKRNLTSRVRPCSTRGMDAWKIKPARPFSVRRMAPGPADLATTSRGLTASRPLVRTDFHGKRNEMKAPALRNSKHLALQLTGTHNRQEENRASDRLLTFIPAHSLEQSEQVCGKTLGEVAT